MTFACRQLPCVGHLSVRLQLQFRVQFVFVVSVFWSCRLSVVLLCLEIKDFMSSLQLQLTRTVCRLNSLCSLLAGEKCLSTSFRNVCVRDKVKNIHRSNSEQL